MDYYFTRPPLPMGSSTAWEAVLTSLTYNTLNIRSTASNIKLIRFVLLRRPLMLLGMEPTPAMYLACLALRGGLSAFDKCLCLMAGAYRKLAFTVVFVLLRRGL